MRNKYNERMKNILALVVIGSLLLVGCQTQIEQRISKKTSSGRKTQPTTEPKILGKPIKKTVNIYLANQKMEDDAYEQVEQGKVDPENPNAYQFAFPVTRIIDTTTTTIEEDTVKELLKGLTDGDAEQGYKTEIHNISLDSLTIEAETVTAKFSGKKFYLQGDMSGARVRAQIEKTLLQFPQIKKVIIFINGNQKFDSLEG